MMNQFQRVRTWIDAHRYRGPRVNRTSAASAVPLTAVGLAALVGMYGLVSANVMAVNFTTSDSTFKIYSNYVQGISAAGMISQNKGYSASSQVGVAEIGIKTAKLAGLCAIAPQSMTLPGLGATTVSLVLTAGAAVPATFDNSANPVVDGKGNAITYNADGTLSGASLTNSISATDLFLNSNLLKGYGNQISGLNLGQSADTVAASADLNDPTNTAGGGTWPAGQNAPTPGGFGLTAQHLNLGGLDGSSYGINLAGNISLPNLKIQVQTGLKDQSTCPVAAS